MIAFPLDTNLNIFWPHGLLVAKNSAIRSLFTETMVNKTKFVAADKEANKNMDASSNGDPSKPCRACHDFKSWSKMRSRESPDPGESTKVTSPASTHGNPANCPLDREDLGRNTWGFLHTMAAYYPKNPSEEQKKEASDFFTLFSHFYPCEVCAQDLQKQINRFPPKTESQQELSQWLCRVHNRINLRLGKPQFDCSKVNERWRDGWLDGSCD